MDDPNHSTFIENQTSQYVIVPEKLEQISFQIRSMLGIANFELSIQFVEPSEIQSLNHSFRKLNKPTDVLSFPQQEWEKPLTISIKEELGIEAGTEDGPPNILGDIAICPSIAFVNAKDINQTLDREICFLIVHGILHLCGHDHIDPSEEKNMLEQQKAIMIALTEIQPKPPIWEDCVSNRETANV